MKEDNVKERTVERRKRKIRIEEKKRNVCVCEIIIIIKKVNNE